MCITSSAVRCVGRSLSSRHRVGETQLSIHPFYVMITKSLAIQRISDGVNVVKFFYKMIGEEGIVHWSLVLGLLSLLMALSMDSAFGYSVQTVAPSGITSFNIANSSSSSGYTYNANAKYWYDIQPNGYVQFAVSASVAGTYSLSFNYTTPENGVSARILVNGVLQPSQSLPNTENWNTFAMSPGTTIVLPTGASTLTIEAASNAATNFESFNLAGMTLTPAQVVAPSGITNFTISNSSSSSGYTYNSSAKYWYDIQPNGYVQFAVSASVAGTYSLSLNYTTPENGVSARVLVNGVQQPSQSLPNTENWNTFAMSPGTAIVLPAGVSTLTIEAASNAATHFESFNLAGMTVSSDIATINGGTTYQTIQGFGASNHGSAAIVNPYDSFFFSTLGFSLLRTGTPEGNTSCTTIGSDCANGGDNIADMQFCAATPGCKVWATSWSPPAIYKTNNSVNCEDGAGNGTLNPADYALFATYLSNYIASLKSVYNITLYAISPQNEPGDCTAYDSSLMTAANLDTFIKSYLGPTLKANGQSDTLIIMPESSKYSTLTSFASTCMDDPACAAFIGINAFHGYDNSFSITKPYSQPLWETEVSAGTGYGPNAPGCTNGEWCPGIADAMMYADIIDYNIAVAGESAWNFWGMVAFRIVDNEELQIKNGATATRAYVIGNYAKYVRPGFVRISATHAPQNNVTVSAYKNPSTSTAFAIVATNQNTSSVTQTFSLTGLSPKTVTPTITSTSQSLVDLPAVTVSGGTFVYTLPAQSIITFH
jgi:glucuronoarabinoxylan endo-1,4-beta-xylanase